jgi:hypothetical protein
VVTCPSSLCEILRVVESDFDEIEETFPFRPVHKLLPKQRFQLGERFFGAVLLIHVIEIPISGLLDGHQRWFLRFDLATFCRGDLARFALVLDLASLLFRLFPAASTGRLPLSFASVGEVGPLRTAAPFVVAVRAIRATRSVARVDADDQKIGPEGTFLRVVCQNLCTKYVQKNLP